MIEKHEQIQLDKIIEKHPKEQSSLIAVLQEIQNLYEYLPQNALEYVSMRMKIPAAAVFGPATFYENFSFDPKGKHIIKMCDGTSCHVQESLPILHALRKHLGLREEEKTTDDGLFTLEVVVCLGGCAISPVLMLDHVMYPKMTVESALALVDQVRAQEEVLA